MRKYDNPFDIFYLVVLWTAFFGPIILFIYIWLLNKDTQVTLAIAENISHGRKLSSELMAKNKKLVQTQLTTQEGDKHND